MVKTMKRNRRLSLTSGMPDRMSSLRETSFQVLRCRLLDVKSKSGTKEWRTKHLDAIVDDGEKWNFWVEVQA